VTCAFFHSFGLKALDKSLLKKIESGSASALDASFKSLGLTRSGPDALVGLTFTIEYCGDILILLKNADDVVLRDGGSLLMSCKGVC
jgi:hypothetical protein